MRWEKFMSDITSLIGGFILTYISLQLRSDSTEIVHYVPNNLAIHGEINVSANSNCEWIGKRALL